MGGPLAAQRAARHGRLSAASEAPGADVPLATTARAPGQHCLSAAPRAPGHGRPLAAQCAAGHDRLSAASIATVSVPAGLHRLRQECLPRVPANPRTLTYPHSRGLNRHSHRLDRHSRESGNPRPPVATGGPPGGYAPKTQAAYSQTPTRLLAHNTTHQVHPAIQVPPRPRSCSTACTGFLRQHPSRAPPDPCPSLRRKPQTSRTNE